MEANVPCRLLFHLFVYSYIIVLKQNISIEEFATRRLINGQLLDIVSLGSVDTINSLSKIDY